MHQHFVVTCLMATTLMGGSTASSVMYTVPSLRAYPFVYTAQGNSLITPTQEQYLTQDDLGQYAYGYSEPLSSKQEVRSLDGITRGSYSYRDATGKLQTVDYTADAEGFHVAATNLPRTVSSVPSNDFRTPEATTTAVSSAPVSSAGVSDTVAVAAARKAHLALHEEARLRLASLRPTDSESSAIQSNVRFLELSNPVAETAEVAAAKSIHLKRLEAEKLRNEALKARELLPVVYNYPSFYAPRIYY